MNDKTEKRHFLCRPIGYLLVIGFIILLLGWLMDGNCRPSDPPPVPAAQPAPVTPAAEPVEETPLPPDHGQGQANPR